MWHGKILGGNGLFNLTWEGEEVTVLGLDEDGSSAASLALAFRASSLPVERDRSCSV
ncbi:hypothetical protein L195_g048249 [Trifolium pratense]|uniref:Uncharacterized protein n=1 Tax=Trifolium pratense TaxID=57577 RepID=A0A2K3JKR5_TRIPR|nr:hypothetical protein L195_g048249 [Trifolium pratense]